MRIARSDEPERRRRARQRGIDAPETTFGMTDADHDRFLAAIRMPTAAEVDAVTLSGCPAGWASRGARAAGRLPTLPLVETGR